MGGSSSQPVVLTADGRRQLEERLRIASQTARELAETLGEGDLTTDGEYHRLRAQIEELTDLLEKAQEPAAVPDDPWIVELGDEFEVEFDDGEVERYLLVHPVEAALDEQRVSVASPLGTAVLGRAVGDRVSVAAPSGSYSVTIRTRRRAR